MNNTSLLDHVFEKIKNTPDAIAIIDDSGVITYRDLGIHVVRLTQCLRDQSVQPGDYVVICMRRSFEALVSILSIWELEAAYLAIDPQTPFERINQILKEANPKCVISEPALLSKLTQQDIPVVTLRNPAYNCSEVQNLARLPLNYINHSKQLAYIIYTSGSTGTPKGVMVSHRNLENHIAWLIEHFQFTSKDIFSFNSPLAFDFSVPCTIAPLVLGATIVITNESDTLIPKSYFQQLAENRVTFVKWTPSYFKLLVEYVEKHTPELSSFRYLMVAGEKLPTNYVERWLKIYPDHYMINEYGPTETTVGATAHIFTRDTLDRSLSTVPIGVAVKKTTLYVVDPENYQSQVKQGEVGELLIGGASVAVGYHNRPDLTQERFLDDPFYHDPGKVYKTGDLVQELPDGSYLHLGRIDHQVKINGYRIELHEIEHRLLQYSAVKQAAVIVNNSDPENHALVACIVLREGKTSDKTELSHYLSQHLPHYMLPQDYHLIDHIPLTINGKRDDAKLQKDILQIHVEEKETPISASKYSTPLLRILKKYTHAEHIKLNLSFFSLGITSLLAARIVMEINQTCHISLKINVLFLYPTPQKLIDFLETQNAVGKDSYEQITQAQKQRSHHMPIAIIAMECRYPGAEDCDEFWKMCRNGKESISFFDTSKTPEFANNPSYVYARGVLNNIEYFDAEFFRFTPKEAHLSDPQHRLFLESAWTTLEKAGYAVSSPELGTVGVYVSMNDSTYIIHHNMARLTKNAFGDEYSALRLMSTQFLGTKVAYHLNCTGPAFTLQTACSSSLVSVVVACQQLSAYQCDVALAGGVSITTPQDKPYLYQPDNIFSPDGHCRPFDAEAKGTVFSNGLGIVVLKRLEDAVRDNDTILGVIKGGSINNDGSEKMSYAAPSIQSQAACISSAQTIAGVDAESIQYVEAHGTGTLVGDPIEIEALTRAFRKTSDKIQFCAIGSVKANMGHTHVAAGVGGLIKTVLALQNHEIPPVVNFTQPNPDIDFEHSPFYVNSRLQYWPRKQKHPRRAAVSAFGVGGTNAHVILEEAPERESNPTNRQYHALLLSAKTTKALEAYHEKLIQYLEEAHILPEEESAFLADVAHTLQVGRSDYEYRSGVVSNSIADAIGQLKKIKNTFQHVNNDPSHLQIIFLFSGQGTQYANMSWDLYQEEGVYRKHLDRCLEIASAYMQMDLKKILFNSLENIAEKQLYETEFAHPILFSIEYSLAQLLISLGVKPNGMLGHSLGEYVAACVAGVFPLEDAIKIICARGNAIAKCPKGEMLAVGLSQEKLAPFCDEDVSIAAINAPELCVVSGTKASIETLRQKLASVFSDQPLSIHEIKSHYPFHSPLLEPAVDSLQSAFKPVTISIPTIPYLSNLTGDWVTGNEILQSNYWTEHMLKPVQFSACAQKLLENPNAIFLEIGPGSTLLSLLQQHSKQTLKTLKLLPGVKSKNETRSHHQVAEVLKQLWVQGYKVEWNKYYQHEKRRRIPLPTYPFQRQRYWFDSIVSTKNQESAAASSASNPDLSLYIPKWTRDSEPLNTVVPTIQSNQKHQWIIFDNESDLSQKAMNRLNELHEDLIIIQRGKHFKNKAMNCFTINPQLPEHYVKVFEKIITSEIKKCFILHFWLTDEASPVFDNDLLTNSVLYEGFYSGVFIAKALSQCHLQPYIFFTMLTTQAHSVLGDQPINPFKSMVSSISRVLPLESPNFEVHHINMDASDIQNNSKLYANTIISQTLKKAFSHTERSPDTCMFYKKYLWTVNYDLAQLKQSPETPVTIKPNSTYLITGGLGGMGLTFANWLSEQEPSITLVLISRTPFPEQSEWNSWSEKNGDPVQDSTYQKIQLLKRIIERGTCVVIKVADVTDDVVMKKIIDQIGKSSNPLKGVLHLAGIPGKGLASLKDVGTVQTVLAPKMQGIQILAKLLSEKELDFVACASSLTAIAGGVGQVDYCAANIFLDSFMSLKPFKKCRKHLTINWNAWISVGMAATVTDSKIHSKLYKENSISPTQGIAVFQSLLSSPYTQVVVSRFAPTEEVKRIIDTFNPNASKEEKESTDQSLNHLSEIGIYESVVECWREVLGVDTLQENDHFYQLGGDSLLAIQLIMLLKKKFNIELGLQDLSHAPTVASMVKLVEHRPIQSEQIIVPLSEHSAENNSKVIYFIHPLGGTIFCYFPLIKHLKATYSYYAIQDPELMTGKNLFGSLHDMAAEYANAICQHQCNKKTDIILAGFSFGGNVAIEVAAELKKISVPIQKIILLDSWANLSKISDNHASNPSEELETLKNIRQYYGAHSSHYQLIKTHLSWLQDHTPALIDIPIILFKAMEILPHYKFINDESNGWKIHFKKLTIYQAIGNHDTLLKSDNLSNLCNVLNVLL